MLQKLIAVFVFIYVMHIGWVILYELWDESDFSFDCNCIYYFKMVKVF